MQTSDARLIIDLADSVRNAAPIQKDAEAAQLISQLIGSQPDALYFLVQTVLLQKEALAAQQAQPAPDAGGPYAASAAVAPPGPAETEERRGRWGGLFGSRRQTGPAEGGSGGGSFLKTAAAGAAGVAGGVLLAQGISGLMSAPHDQNHAEDDDDSDWDDDGWESF
ncbi:DUF2076 family protein [Microbacterium azadirachtae]|uniref:DUF2076 domain-containing protein n=1 Tax=Microbacterium azadirachtae TaxID=582680 RepID=A0A0F0LKP8_9MICO|nr:DUF2076 family protein [Microbacterium azadirachtae]KJL33787.1 hypothetical protein RS86_01584 [Microbacterium azadirachtae]